MQIVCTMKPIPRRIQKRDVKHAIEHARYICLDYENTKECALALHRAKKIKEEFIQQGVNTTDLEWLYKNMDN